MVRLKRKYMLAVLQNQHDLIDLVLYQLPIESGEDEEN